MPSTIRNSALIALVLLAACVSLCRSSFIYKDIQLGTNLNAELLSSTYTVFVVPKATSSSGSGTAAIRALNVSILATTPSASYYWTTWAYPCVPRVESWYGAAGTYGDSSECRSNNCTEIYTFFPAQDCPIYITLFTSSPPSMNITIRVEEAETPSPTNLGLLEVDRKVPFSGVVPVGSSRLYTFKAPAGFYSMQIEIKPNNYFVLAPNIVAGAAFYSVFGSRISPVGYFAPLTDYSMLVTCQDASSDCPLTGSFIVPNSVTTVVPGAPSLRFALTGGDTKNFRVVSSSVDPGLRYATVTFDVSSSGLSEGYFQLVLPGDSSSTSMSISSSTIEACAFRGDSLWAVAYANAPVNITVAAQAAGTITNVDVALNTPMAFSRNLLVMVLDGMTGGSDKLLRIAVRSYASEVNIIGRFGSWANSNARCNLPVIERRLDSAYFTQAAVRSYAVLPCQVGAALGQTGRFYASFTSNRIYSGSDLQNATFSYVDPVVVTPGAPQNTTIAVYRDLGVIVRAPANAVYPIVLRFISGSLPQYASREADLSVINTADQPCGAFRTEILSPGQEFAIELNSAYEVAYITWAVSSDIIAPLNITVSASQSLVQRLTLDTSVSRLISFEFTGDSSSTWRDIVITFPTISIFEYTVRVNTSGTTGQCFNELFQQEPCESMTPSTKKILRIIQSYGLPQLVTLNITSVGREGCVQLGSGHTCSDLFDWISPFATAPLGFTAPNDTIYTLNLLFPTVSASCRETIRRTVCKATIRTCEASGRITAPPCKQECRRDVAASCPELPAIMIVAACPYNSDCPPDQTIGGSGAPSSNSGAPGSSSGGQQPGSSSLNPNGQTNAAVAKFDGNSVVAILFVASLVLSVLAF